MEINSLPFEVNEILHQAVVKQEIKEGSNVQARQVLPRVPHSTAGSQIYCRAC